MKTLLILLLLVGAAHAEEEPGFHQDPGALVPLGGLLHGRPTALALVYYHCPNLCGILLADFLSALQQSGMVAGRDYDLLVMSIDPADKKADADEAKAQYIARYPLPGAQTGWQFLTKDPRVERAVGYSARFDQATQQFEHPAGIVMLTPDGRVSNYLLGVGYTPKDVADGVRTAGQREIAQPKQEIRLFCFRYDSSTGRYTLAIFRALQLFGGLAAAGLALALFLALRWERRT